MIKSKGIVPIRVPKAVQSKVLIDKETEKAYQLLDPKDKYLDRLPFVKLFKGDNLRFIARNLTLNEFKLLIMIADSLDLNKDVIKITKEEAKEYCQWENDATFFTAQKGLIAKGILHKISRGVHQVNPNVIFNGVRIKT